MGDLPEGLLREDGEDALLAIAVQPGAKRATVGDIDVWRVRLQVAVRAPPVKGAANEAVCELLAEAFGVPLALVEIDGGHRSRQKSVRLRETSVERIRTLLEAI